MKTFLAGISIGVGIASLAWLVFIDISARFEFIPDKLNRHEQAIGILINLKAQGQ